MSGIFYGSLVRIVNGPGRPIERGLDGVTGRYGGLSTTHGYARVLREECPEELLVHPENLELCDVVPEPSTPVS